MPSRPARARRRRADAARLAAQRAFFERPWAGPAAPPPPGDAARPPGTPVAAGAYGRASARSGTPSRRPRSCGPARCSTSASERHAEPSLKLLIQINFPISGTPAAPRGLLDMDGREQRDLRGSRRALARALRRAAARCDDGAMLLDIDHPAAAGHAATDRLRSPYLRPSTITGPRAAQGPARRLGLLLRLLGRPWRLGRLGGSSRPWQPSPASGPWAARPAGLASPFCTRSRSRSTKAVRRPPPPISFSSRASAAAIFGLASSSAARPASVRRRRWPARPASSARVPAGPWRSSGAAMSASVERSMPVIRTRSAWVAPSCSAAAASTANWRWVIGAGAELLGVDVERALQRPMQQMARRALQRGRRRPSRRTCSWPSVVPRSQLGRLS